MDEAGVRELLSKLGAVIVDSHIVYTSGKHGTAYVNKDAIYPHTAETSRLCRAMAIPFSIMEEVTEVVIAPAVGGVPLSQWTAHHLSDIQGNKVLALYAEKEGDDFVIKRGYDKLIVGKRTLVVEDVLTTGGSAKKVVEVARASGGHVVGLSVICNRGGITRADVADVPKLEAQLNVQLDAWDEDNCPMCQANIPINTNVGKGREFLARKQR